MCVAMKVLNFQCPRFRSCLKEMPAVLQIALFNIFKCFVGVHFNLYPIVHKLTRVRCA